MKSEDFFVSVIIPTYNRSNLISRAVRSALNATSPGDEIIVIDDGSTDNTKDVLARFSDCIRYFRIPHRGAGAARNHGVAAARNALIAFLDSDDEWMPDKLFIQRRLMQQRPDLAFCFSDFIFQDHSGMEHHNHLQTWLTEVSRLEEVLGPGINFSSIGDLPDGRADFLVYFGDLYPEMMGGYYVTTFTSVVRRDLAGDSLYFSEDLATFEDWECFARLAKNGPAAYLACETARQYGHTGPRLTDTDDFQCAVIHLKMLKRIWGADQNFMEHNHDLYQQAVKTIHLKMARWLIGEGRRCEARQELRLAGSSPISYHLFANLPGPLAKSIISIYRKLFRRRQLLYADLMFSFKRPREL